VDRNETRTKAYGLAATVTAIDGFTGGQAGLLLPFGSGLSLAAAGLVLLCWPALATFAARLAATIFATWAIVLKAPLIAAEPANEYAWVGFLALLGLAAIGPRLGAREDEPDTAQVLLPIGSWWPHPDPAPRSLPGCHGSGR